MVYTWPELTLLSSSEGNDSFNFLELSLFSSSSSWLNTELTSNFFLFPPNCIPVDSDCRKIKDKTSRKFYGRQTNRQNESFWLEGDGKKIGSYYHRLTDLDFIWKPNTGPLLDAAGGTAFIAGCLMMIVAGGAGGRLGVADLSLVGGFIIWAGREISERLGTRGLAARTGEVSGDSSLSLSSALFNLAISSSGSLSGYSSCNLRLSSSTSSFSFFLSRSSDSISRSLSRIRRERAEPEVMC